MPIRQLIELIAPPECLGCGFQGSVVCAGCRAAAPAGRVVSVAGGGNLSSVYAAAAYRNTVRELVLALKFQHSRSAANAAVELMSARLGQLEADLVTAVPIAPGRYRERGYNQSELIAKGLARRLGLPYRRVLGRLGTEHQIGRSRAERLHALNGVFYATKDLGGRRVLLIDDVVTTGSTIAECGRILTLAGAPHITGATIAYR